MDFRKLYGTDRDAELEGIELHISDDAFVTIARAGGANVRYDKTIQRLYREHRRAIDAGVMSIAAQEDLTKQAYAETVVLDWRGIELDGQPLPFSRENALRLLREFPDFWDAIHKEARNMENYRAEEIVDLGKASPTG